MAAHALTWRRAAVIAVRDLRSAPGKFLFVVLSVAIGVAALVGVRGFSEIFRATLSREARSLMAGDLSARMNQQPTDAERAAVDALHAQSIRTTWVTEMVSMASVAPDPVPLLVSLKVVDPAEYPYYGSAELDPAQSLASALTDNSVVVADEFLIRLHARVGDTVKLGSQLFRIAAVLRQEPDRISASAGLGPRVLISRAAFERTGLLAPGSRATERLLVEVPPALQTAAQLAALRSRLETTLPQAQVIDYREGNPALTEGLDRAASILSLICLVAMVLGAIGVAMSMHAHLGQRVEVLAIFKSLGADSADLLRIFLLQTLGLGLLGALLGVVAGLLVMAALPLVFGALLPVHASFALPWRSVFSGFATGVLTTLLFCLPPLLDVRNVRPILVLRRAVAATESAARPGWLRRIAERRVQLVAATLTVVGLAFIARWLTDSATVARDFALALVAVLLVLLAVSAGFLRLLRALLNRIRLRLPQAPRLGLANLYRPGNQSAAVLAALGTGVMLILSVFLMQSQVLTEIRQSAAPTLPNLFLIDMTAQQVPGITEFFHQQTGVSQSLELLPVVSGRFLSINGAPIGQMRHAHFPRRMLENATFSWADSIPAGDKLVAGQWWGSSDASSIAVSKGIADRIHVGIGSVVDVEVAAQTHHLTVVALFRADEEHISARSGFLLPSGLLKDAPAIWYGAVRVDPARIPQIERSLFQLYPNVSVVNLADVLTRIESVVGQITFVIRFLAGFSIFAGLIILASSVASTRFRRTRETVVLKTFGATRRNIVAVYTVEFFVLGTLAALVGVCFANLLTRILVQRLDIHWHMEWLAAFVAICATAVLATCTGWIASHRILGLRPLEILREE